MIILINSLTGVQMFQQFFNTFMPNSRIYPRDVFFVIMIFFCLYFDLLIIFLCIEFLQYSLVNEDLV